MKFGALLGWGIVIYAIVFLSWSIFGAYGWTTGYIPRGVELLILAFICIVAGRALRLRNWKDILPYSISWAAIAALLDAVFTFPSQSWSLYSGWVWTGYILVALLPLFSIFFHHEPNPARTWET